MIESEEVEFNQNTSNLTEYNSLINYLKGDCKDQIRRVEQTSFNCIDMDDDEVPLGSLLTDEQTSSDTNSSANNPNIFENFLQAEAQLTYTDPLINNDSNIFDGISDGYSEEQIFENLGVNCLQDADNNLAYLDVLLGTNDGRENESGRALLDQTANSQIDEFFDVVRWFETHFPLSNDIHPAPNVQVRILTENIELNLQEWFIKIPQMKKMRRPRLFEFLLLLLRKKHYESYAAFKNEKEGIFEIHQPEKVADLWEQVKSRQSHQKMTYDKLARAVRWYYSKDIMKRTNTRHTFQFSQHLLNNFHIDDNNTLLRDIPNLH